jgi:integrase
MSRHALTRIAQSRVSFAPRLPHGVRAVPKRSHRVLSADRQIQTVRANGARAEYRIAGARNLVLRISANGTKSWVFLYADPDTRSRRKVKMGFFPALTLAAARARCLRLNADLAEGKCPRPAPMTATLTFATLADEYLREHAKIARRAGPGSWTAEVRRILNAEILPAIGSVPADAVTRPMISGAVEAVARRGSYSIADKTLGVVRSIYRWAVGTGRSDRDPTMGIAKRNAGRPRARVLSDAEIRKLWQTIECADLSLAIGDALRLQLLLGLRIGEAIGASRSEIDLTARTWTIPATRTKSGRQLQLPLPPLAHGILHAAMERSARSDWLYPSRNKTCSIRAKSAMRAMARLCERAGIEDASSHDLRRTVATRLGEADVPEGIIARILNHSPSSVTGKHYNHSRNLAAMERALVAWDAGVGRIISAADEERPDVSANLIAA